MMRFVSEEPDAYGPLKRTMRALQPRVDAWSSFHWFVPERRWALKTGMGASGLLGERAWRSGTVVQGVEAECLDSQV